MHYGNMAYRGQMAITEINIWVLTTGEQYDTTGKYISSGSRQFREGGQET